LTATSSSARLRWLQAAFLNAVFVRLFGYMPALSGRTPFALSEHVGTEVDATEADGTLGGSRHLAPVRPWLFMESTIPLE
jgi:hypothetical protein